MARTRITDAQELIDAARGGDRAALARLISQVEQGGEPARRVGRVTHRLGGHTYTIGVTGAPGSGKSTLTNALVANVRATGDEVAVLAIDPSSPFTGGAILGDRVRMGDHVLDAGVFIRSMATRGHLGGLALATPEAVRVLDAAGKPWVIIETVGVGQVEVEITGAADTTVVVVNPGWGDAVQANKAGLMEIADIFVINKADRPGARETRRDLEQMLEFGFGGDPMDGHPGVQGHSDIEGHSPMSGHPGANTPAPDSSIGSPARWRPPIIETVASSGEGVAELWRTIGTHRRHLVDRELLGPLRAERATQELRHIISARLMARAAATADDPGFVVVRDAVLARTLDPWSAADRLLGSTD